MHLLFRILVLLIIANTFGCRKADSPAIFHHEFSTENQPWTHLNFDGHPDQFSFAVISDLYGGERPGIFDVAIEQVNLLHPELILTVGDLIDGGTEDTVQLIREWDRFDERAEKFTAPLFYTGGNHDLTNVTMRNFWEERYGARYYHFVYKNVLFLVLDSEDFNPERMQDIHLARLRSIEVLESDTPEQVVNTEYWNMDERLTGEIRSAQAEYFSEVLARYPDVRWTFLFMHKPVWSRENAEGWKTIENKLQSRPYTVINGHFHSYAHTTKNNRDHIILGTTSGAQSADDPSAFDHIMYITVTENGPDILNLRLDGILDKTGHIPVGGDSLCFQASRCF
ncbi:metallophosphoesterase family protein [Fulvivirga sedimenti]|uniref:Metallophosphoesterase n=1 Tax=Fulvivirga sedimenti TaxID=2879465 RepID=A0A9X1HXY1_9BACT|nr:metallophosphoesterase [Fulvivirga sedimenti]MCA6079073.1 metallophosphoesterase [Fulvivirga sedimenti]